MLWFRNLCNFVSVMAVVILEIPVVHGCCNIRNFVSVMAAVIRVIS